MQIKIAERLRPYSHIPGTYCILPGSSRRLQVFPAFIRVHDLAGPHPKLIEETALDIQGPVKDFTVLQDLEKGIIKVWGHAAKGFFRNEYAVPSPSNSPSIDRLSLGWHKAQDWSAMQERKAMEEIFPIWFRLGQNTPHYPSKPAGTIFLLEKCRQIIQERKTTEIIQAFRNLFLCGFEGMLSPRLKDEQHQGFELPPLDTEASPLFLLSEGAKLIRSLFFKQNEQSISILPALPPEFHCGRLVNVSCAGLGILDMEWSKKTIRRMIFHAHRDSEIVFVFRANLKKFRLRENAYDQGRWTACDEQIKIQSGNTYFLDNFQR